MKQLFQAPSVIQNLRTLADSTIRMQVDFQELDPKEMSKIFELKGKLGWLLFRENAIKEEDLPEEDAPLDKNEKSPSKRLRDRMFVYYKQKNNSSTGFRMWYEEALEKIGQNYLNKID